MFLVILCIQLKNFRLQAIGKVLLVLLPRKPMQILQQLFTHMQKQALPFLTHLFSAGMPNTHTIVQGPKLSSTKHWTWNGALIYKHPHSRSILAVSYTHLRAHETPEHLVCR